MKKRTRMMAAMVLAVAILLSAAAGCASTEVNVEEPAEEREETIEPVTETEEKNEPEPEPELVEATRDDIKALASMLSKAAPADVQVKEYYHDLKGTVSGEQSRLTADVLSALSKISWENGVKNEYSPTYELVIDGESGKLTLSCVLDDFWPDLSPCDVCVKTEGKEYWLRIDEAQDNYVGYLLRMLYNDGMGLIEIDATGDRELLTADELIKWQYELRRCDYDADGRIKGYNLSASFLNSTYKDPRDISPYPFLWYSALHSYNVEAETHPEEYEACVAAGITAEDVHWPIWQCSVSDINAVLKKYAGITLDDMNTDWKKEISYLPEYDAFYVGISSMSDGGFQVMNGYREGDIITLFNDWNSVLKLKLVDGGYHFVSLQCDRPRYIFSTE